MSDEEANDDVEEVRSKSEIKDPLIIFETVWKVRKEQHV